MRENDKTFITRENLLAILKKQQFEHILYLFLSLLAVAFLNFLTYFIWDLNRFIAYVVAWIPYYIFCIYIFIKRILMIKNLNENNINIVADRVVKKDMVTLLRRRLNYKIYILFFAKYKRFIISKKQHYKWSKKDNMTDKEFFNCTEIGDEFYIILSGKKTIYDVFNKKFFEFEE